MTKICFPERDGMKLRSDFGFFIFLLKILVARIINEMPRVVQTAKANIMLENGNIDRQQVLTNKISKTVNFDS